MPICTICRKMIVDGWACRECGALMCDDCHCGCNGLQISETDIRLEDKQP